MNLANEVVPLLHTYVLDVPARSRVRVTTTNKIIVEGDVLENPKNTGLTSWLEIVNCVYVEPKAYGRKEKLTYNKREIADLTILNQPIASIPVLVMDTYVVTNHPQLIRVMESLDFVEAAGLAFHGIQVGRFGKVSWVALNCRGNLITIDIQSMGANEDITKVWPILRQGLFENSNVIKVVHDVRPIVDYLFHQHAITMKNVFDIQVAEFYVRPKNSSKTSDGNSEDTKGLMPLDGVLAKYLSHKVIKEEIEFYAAFRTDSKIIKSEILFVRPFINEDHKKAIALSVKYLIELKKVFSQKLQENYLKCVDVQISSIVDGDLIDMINFLGKPELLSENTAKKIAGAQQQEFGKLA